MTRHIFYKFSCAFHCFMCLSLDTVFFFSLVTFRSKPQCISHQIDDQKMSSTSFLSQRKNDMSFLLYLNELASDSKRIFPTIYFSIVDVRHPNKTCILRDKTLTFWSNFKKSNLFNIFRYFQTFTWFPPAFHPMPAFVECMFWPFFIPLKLCEPLLQTVLLIPVPFLWHM